VKGDQCNRIAKLQGYLNENAEGLGDYRWEIGEKATELRRTGAMEGNIDKLVVRRTKNQGMSWSIQGLKSLLCIRFLSWENKLIAWLENRHSPVNEVMVKISRKLVTRLSSQESDQWLKAAFPALSGPHANRPWVLALKSLAEGAVF
jgi:hypothetical protein